MLLPLDMLKTGESGQVAEVHGDPAWVGRLAELGIRQGCMVRVLASGSTCLLSVGGCKLCLRGGECSQILVIPA